MEENKLGMWIKKNIENARGEKIVFQKNAGIPDHQFKHAPRHAQHFKPHTKPHTPPPPVKRGVLRVIPLGGLDEVGKNMMVFEYENDIIIVDMGFQFPEEDMLGVDYVIPDITYLKNKTDRIRGILITHGHLDHIGGISYLMPHLNFPPIFATPLTNGLILKRLEEFGLERKVKLHNLDPAKPFRLGNFNLDFFRVNHSIPDSIGIILKTPCGTLVHTGDFKFDNTPVHQHPTDYAKIASLGSQNVLALFSDSTNALKPGSTPSEKKIGETLEVIIKEANGRIIIAAFASLIGRIQGIMNLAAKYGRKVFLSGRSMNDNVAISRQLQYIKTPPNLVHPIRKIGRTKDEHTLILTTGAQGEAYSALTRMALGDHAQVSIRKGDTVVISSSPIPGNERAIYTTINNLVRLGAKVIFSQVMDVHTSGHANQEDLKLMMRLTKPKHLVPIHGELYMRSAHAELATKAGVPIKQSIILENGDVMEISKDGVRKTREKVPANYIMIDGKGVGDVGAQVIMDRQIMAENGVLIVLFHVDPKNKNLLRKPEVITRGFIYMRESQELAREIINIAESSYKQFINKNRGAKRGEAKMFIRSALDRFTHQKIERHPLILPVFVGYH